MLAHAAQAHVLAAPRLSGVHPGPRLALGFSLLLHGVAMAWMLRDAPPPPEVPAPRVQVALIEAPRPHTPSESVPAEPEPTPAPPVAVAAPMAPARPEPTPEPTPEVKPRPRPSVVERKPPPAPVESRPEPPTQAKAEPAPTIIAPGYEADYLDNPPPDYPRLSRRLREEGEVELRVRVSPAGQPVTVELTRSSGSERLDAAALRAVRQWRFAPARQGGQAVEAWVRVPIFFKLEA